MTNAYPLDWPEDTPRTPADERKRANFNTRRNDHYGKRGLSIADAHARLKKEVELYTRAGHIYRIVPDLCVLSSNVEVRKDGMPYSNRKPPEDPGVAFYYTLDNEPMCIPIDTYDRVADNIAAIAQCLSDLRSLERHGHNVSKKAYSGFVQLADREHWRTVLQLDRDSTLEEAERSYKVLSLKAHPDRGGSEEQQQALNDARQQAREFFKR